MNIYITLDYELFFGSESGTIDNCIIKPTQELLNIVEPYNIKIICFVDAGYIVALEKYKAKFPELEVDYQKITDQISYLSQNNHGIELHIHPHWENSYYDGSKWVFNTDKYKLSDFNTSEVENIVKKYNDVLIKISNKSPKAFRAGGWSAQPFSHIKNALLDNNVLIDSSVYPKGYYNSKNQEFDFRNVDNYKTKYNFSDDLTQEDVNGLFTEIPISSCEISPFFFWNFAFKKIFKQDKHTSFGDGIAIKMNKKGMIRLMLTYSYSVVSIDGFKSSLIKRSFNKYINNTKNQGNFVLIGHPKAFTPYSLKKLQYFVKNNVNKHEFKVF